MRFAAPFALLLAASCSTNEDVATGPAADAAADTSADTGLPPLDTGPGDGGGDAACKATEVKCSGACVDTKTDAKHCGGCAKVCTSGQTCVAGACACSPTSTKCGTTCVDTMVDAKNCGGCGKECALPAKCESGICITPCPSGTPTKCAEKCVDTSSDASHCGACGKPCATGESCVSGACALTCDAPLAKCGTKCVNTGFDSDHCGGCDKKCPTGAKATPACTSGSCLVICDAGYGNCNDKSDDGCEVTLATDHKNCGKCGNACGTTDTCVGGECKCSGGGTKCPDGKCADLTSDVTHCGSCTTACGANMVCSGSACVCKTGWVLCGDTCYETSCPPTGFIGSALITTTHSTLINGWVGTPSAIWTRCYSKSVDGASASTFHSKCDGKGASVTVARLNSSGTLRLMGAYSPVAFASTGTANNPGTFIFSLTNSFQHGYRTGTSSSYTQYFSTSYGPTYGGGHDWYISSSMNSGYCYFGYTFKCRIGSDGGTDSTCQNDLCGTYSSWTIDDLEVWTK